MICEIKFLLDFMVEWKERAHLISSIPKLRPFVENVSTLSKVYSTPKEELLAMAIGQDLQGLDRFMSNHPQFQYFSKEKGQSSLVHYLAQTGNVKILTTLLSSISLAKEKSQVVNLPGWRGSSPVEFAASSGRLEMVKVSFVFVFLFLFNLVLFNCGA